jgi:hypothetical protein
MVFESFRSNRPPRRQRRSKPEDIIRPPSARKEHPYPLDSALERIIRKALVELAEPVDINMMVAIVFDRVIDAVDDDAGIGPEDAIDDNFAITRRRLRELTQKSLDELDDVRLETMVNTRDAVCMVARLYNFAITRRRLRELTQKSLDELDDVRLETMVNTRDAVCMVARRLAPIVDDCVAKGFLAMPSVPRPRRQPPRTARRNHRKPSLASASRERSRGNGRIA